jgi:hypothetical protein
MGLAYDTVAFGLANPGATFAAATAATGDSFVVRSFPATAHGYLLRVVRQGVTEGGVRILSPLLHDNVRGITQLTVETPTVFAFPREVKQELRPQDALSVLLTGGTGETDAGCLINYYTDLPGASARLFSPADIVGRIKSIKPLEVDLTPTANAWLDTVITTTEDLTHANTDYAVLGYTIDNPIVALGIKGIDTSNFRVCGPGSISSLVTADFFWEMSLRDGLPCIPVFNSANKGGTFVSTYGVPSVASKVLLNLAELTS